MNWVGALRRHDDNREKQFRGLCGPVEAAVIRVSEAVGSPIEPERWRQLLLELARQQARIDRNKTFRESLPPLPRLRAEWFDRAWPVGSFGDEIAVARSVASVGADTAYPSLVNVFGVELAGRQIKFAGKARPPGRKAAVYCHLFHLLLFGIGPSPFLHSASDASMTMDDAFAAYAAIERGWSNRCNRLAIGSDPDDTRNAFTEEITRVWSASDRS